MTVGQRSQFCRSGVLSAGAEVEMALSYMPRLDGLRAIAISGVLLTHFLPKSDLLEQLSLGGMGVRLFFVLSGYLISRILFDLREDGLPLREAAAHFYWRRLLRLSPPYYAAIVFCLVVGIASMRQEWWIHALYLTNFLVAWRHDWGPVGHFWSLAVEEQFYIGWFIVVMLLPKRFLLSAILLGLVGSIAYRTITIVLGFDFYSRVLLPGVADFLLFGALLAYLQVYRPNRYSLLANALTKPMIFIALAAGSFAAVFIAAANLVVQSAFPSVWMLFFGAVIVAATNEHASRSSAWLAWGPLVHLGRISYGVYVYHLIVLLTLELFVPSTRDLMQTNLWPIVFFANLALTFLVAELSWRFMEQPLRRYRTLSDSWFKQSREGVA
jgi:peptidoglycan/LPS O-acetylase OafA/YrhL